jgi:hypothetical protein
LEPTNSNHSPEPGAERNTDTERITTRREHWQVCYDFLLRSKSEIYKIDSVIDFQPSDYSVLYDCRPISEETSKDLSKLEVFVAAVVYDFSACLNTDNGVALNEHSVSTARKTEHESLVLPQLWLHNSGLWCSPMNGPLLT